jgi:hypothetical protein
MGTLGSVRCGLVPGDRASIIGLAAALAGNGGIAGARMVAARWPGQGTIAAVPAALSVWLSPTPAAPAARLR